MGDCDRSNAYERPPSKLLFLFHACEISRAVRSTANAVTIKRWVNSPPHTILSILVSHPGIPHAVRDPLVSIGAFFSMDFPHTFARSWVLNCRSHESDRPPASGTFDDG